MAEHQTSVKPRGAARPELSSPGTQAGWGLKGTRSPATSHPGSRGRVPSEAGGVCVGGGVGEIAQTGPWRRRLCR